MNYPIETRKLESRNGFDLELSFYYDNDTTPADFECYTGKQIEAYENGDWHYCSLKVTASVCGVVLGEDWLGGVEIGSLPVTTENDELVKTSWVWVDEIIENYPDNLASATTWAIEQAQKRLNEINERLSK